MIEGLAIGALGGIIVAVVTSFILLRSHGARYDRLFSTYIDSRQTTTKREDELDEMRADRDAVRESERILHDNQRELLDELAEHKSSIGALEAQLTEARKAHDDLERILAAHPGAVPAALRAAVDRVRRQIQAAQAPRAAAAGDPNGGGQGAVHAAPHGPGSELEAP